MGGTLSIISGVQLGLIGHDVGRELPDTDIVISQPFWPAYLTAERIAKAPKAIGPHTLRHAFITAALDAGVPLS